MLVTLGISVSLLFAFWTYRDISFKEILVEIGRVDVPILCLTFPAQVLSVFCLAQRSRIMLAPAAVYRFPTLVRSVLVLIVGNNLLPLRIGEFLRVGYLAREGDIPVSATLAVAVVERTLDILCLVVLLFVAISFSTFPLSFGQTVPVLAVCLVLVLASVIALSRSEAFVPMAGKWAQRLTGERLATVLTTRGEQFVLGLKALSSPVSVVGAVLCSFLYWFAQVGTVIIWMSAFGFDLPWVAPVVVLAFLTVGSMLPSSPGYVGTFHYAVAYALGLFSVQDSAAASFALVTHAITTVPITLVSIPFLFAAGALSQNAALSEDGPPSRDTALDEHAGTAQGSSE